MMHYRRSFGASNGYVIPYKISGKIFWIFCLNIKICGYKDSIGILNESYYYESDNNEKARDMQC